LEKERHVHYEAFYLVDTSFWCPLDGKYKIEDYVLIPSLKTRRNSESGCSSFVLRFDFQGIKEKGFDSNEEARRKFINKSAASLKAKIFLAWMVCATGNFARLSSTTFGGMMSGGPSTHVMQEDFDETKLSSFNIDRTAKKGEFITLKRPDLEKVITPETRSLKLPSDFPILTKKMFSLKKSQRKKFTNACFSHQFALENWTSYPTVSILALVSAVESIMADTYTSKFCQDARRPCPLKSDVMKKFRMFFEQTLTNPLPKHLRKFLNDIYSRRSLFVHKALLGEPGGIRGVFSSYFSDEHERLMAELRNLEKLVNAGLLQWLVRI